MGIGSHPALKKFQILQELSSERGDKRLLARQQSGSVVAVRVLASQELSEEQRSALSKEGALATRLDHDAILNTEALIVEKDFAAVVTEFVPGVSLQRLLRFATVRGVRLPDVCSWYILERVLTALASAHETEDGPVLHRGVSASSVVVGWDGSVKVGDFGLVPMRRIVSGARPGPRSDRDVAPLMAPEEARGDRPDAHTDVFCAALLAIRLATGRTPYARFRDSPSEMILAMAEGNVAHLAQTREDVAPELRGAIDAALEPEREKRTISAERLLGTVRKHVKVAQGKAALAKLVGRWREQLESSVTPWERASAPDDVPEGASGLMKPGTLALAMADERPSDSALVSGAAPDEPWNRTRGAVPAEEAALSPTDPITSLSRVGSTATDALIMPLPAMRLTMPDLPAYDGPPVNVSNPPPKRDVLTGRVVAITTMIVVLVGSAILLFRWLTGP